MKTAEGSGDIVGKELPFILGNGKGSVKVDLVGERFAADSAVYSQELCRLGAQLTMLGYDMPVTQEEAQGHGILPALTELGFTEIETYALSEKDEENYFFAEKKITAGGREYTLIAAAFLGSRLAQWYTNFDSGTGALHKGFGKACDFLAERFDAYLARIGAEKDSAKLFITGHSRGGALADLLAARLIREEKHAKKENIFAYTFAAPNSVLSQERTAPMYDRIFNIVNEEDFVTRCMPREWGYGRYGVTLALPNKRNDAAYKETLERMNRFYASFAGGKRYLPFPKGPETVDKLFRCFSGAVRNPDEYYNRKYKCFGVKMSVHTYFEKTLCGITGTLPTDPENKKAAGLMAATSALRLNSRKVLKAIADFFILYEGLAGVTGEKVSEHYFSMGHAIETYCAFVMCTEEDGLIIL